jgi:DNA-directed RNA polymerase specialized sigma24 family protein
VNPQRGSNPSQGLRAWRRSDHRLPALHRSLSPHASSPAVTELIDKCVEHVDALFLLALLHTGECRQAEQDVIDAIADAGMEHPATRAEPGPLWRLLASHFSVPDDRTVMRGSAAAAIRAAALTPGQRQAMALVAAGRTAQGAAQLLATPVAQVEADVADGTRALGSALGHAPSDDVVVRRLG